MCTVTFPRPGQALPVMRNKAVEAKPVFAGNVSTASSLLLLLLAACTPSFSQKMALFAGCGHRLLAKRPCGFLVLS